MRQPPGHRVTRGPFAAAAAAPLIRLNDPASKDRTARLEPLPNHLQTELIEAAERGQVRAGKGSVRHVEVFQMSGVGTLIIGRPRPLPASDAPTQRYTLDCEEPEYLRVHSDRVDDVFETLSYVDVVNHAKRTVAPALFSVGLIDDITPPSTVFTAYNHYAGPKDICVYPFNGHEGGGTRHLVAKLEFLAEVLSARTP